MKPNQEIPPPPLPPPIRVIKGDKLVIKDIVEQEKHKRTLVKIKKREEAVTACVFSVIVFILSLFYKGKTDDEIRLEETNRQVEEAKKALDTFSINK